MVEEVQKEEGEAGCQGAEEVVASCPLVEEAGPWGVREVLDHGPLVVEEAASMGEAFHLGLEA